MPENYKVTFAPEALPAELSSQMKGNEVLTVACQSCFCLVPEVGLAEHLQRVHQQGEGYVPPAPPPTTSTQPT